MQTVFSLSKVIKGFIAFVPLEDKWLEEENVNFTADNC